MRLSRIFLIPALVLTVSGILPAQQAQPPAPPAPAETPTIKTTTEEVVLDIVVRDKKGKAIKDLQQSEISVTDNGEKQTIKGFRLVEGKEAISQGAKVALDPLRQIRLVTLVFERLNVEPRRIARQAALDLIKGEQAQNVFYAVVTIDQKMYPLQDFTADKEALRKAIEIATSGQYGTYAAEADAVKARIKKALTEPKAPETPTPTVTPGQTPDPNAMQAFGAAALEGRLAQIMNDMLAFDSSISMSEATRGSLAALTSLVRGQFSMPGRKSIIYFTEGMYLPPYLDEQFRGLISTANRANVSFYPVDTRGVGASNNSGISSELSNITKDIADDVTRQDGAVSKNQITAADRAENAMRGNVSMPLRDLASDTGGALIGESNDLRVPLRNLNEDINSYYEVTYSPSIDKYDGSFRKTSVNVGRKDLKVAHRKGYFALPMTTLTSKSASLMPYEMPLLNALTANPFPTAIDFRSTALRTSPEANGSKVSVIVEVPMNGITFTEDKTKGTYKARVSVVALVKDEKGEVVQKFSRDLPLQGTVTQIPQVKAGNFVYKEQAELAPGKYTLETAVMDGETTKVGARKIAFAIPPQKKGVQISNLTLVRAYEPNAKNLDPGEPFQFQGGRVTPSLTGTVYAVKGAQLSVFMTVYPDLGTLGKPSLTIEYLIDGQVVAKGEVPLPEADSKGRIQYVMSSPAESLPPGNYQIRATAKQGDTKAEETTTFTVAPPKS